MRRLPAAYVAALAFLAPGVLATASAQEADPPARAARLGVVEGAVSLEPAGLDEWTAAERNRPLTTGDRLWTDQNAVAELDLGDSVIRLGGMTGFAFLNLDDRFAQLQLTSGVLIVRVWGATDAGDSYEIDTPNLALSLQQPGVYRVEVDEAGGTTTVKVSDGQALAIGTDQSIPITTQQEVTFTGTANLSYSAADLGAPDDFDNWSATRDRQVQESPSSQYVADGMPGGDALDDNGRWMQTPEYGTVWMPVVVAVGWVPYRFGHWVFIAPWGWTWVDEAPWGYAPFHYGRWVRLSGMWCWVPGPRHMRPVYAPALVAWVHPAGPGAGGALPGHVGWLPLGPHEVYAPAYPVSADYLRNVNLTNTTITNTTVITDVYQKRVTDTQYINSTTAAVTAVPQSVFTSAQRVSGHAVPVSAATLAGSATAASAPPIAPIRQSALGPGARPGGRRPPSSIVNRSVVAHTPPPRAPAPFEKQLAAIQAKGGRPLARSELAHLEPGTPTARVRLINPGGTLQAREPSLGERARPLASPSLPPASGSGTTAAPRTFTTSPPVAPTSPPRTDRPPRATPRDVERIPQTRSVPPPQSYARPPAPKSETREQGAKQEERQDSNPRADRAR